MTRVSWAREPPRVPRVSRPLAELAAATERKVVTRSAGTVTRRSPGWGAGGLEPRSYEGRGVEVGGRVVEVEVEGLVHLS